MTTNSNSQILFICFLTEAIICACLWLWNDYLASLVSIILPGIGLAILLISFIVELLEKSNVPRLYYQLMLIGIFTPVIIALFYLWIMDGYIEWFHQ